MKVLAFTKYDDMAASTRQRFLQFQTHLNGRGIEIECQPLLSNEHIKRLSKGLPSPAAGVAAAYADRIWQLVSRRDFDAILIYCELFPYLPAFFERLAFLSARPVLYDYDDAIFHMYDRHRHRAVRWLLGGKLESLLKRVRACSCGNEYLKAYAEKFCKQCVVIPTVVDTAVYVPAARNGNDRVSTTIGWIGSPSTWKYVSPLTPLLTKIARDEKVDIRIVGAGSRTEPLAHFQFIEWTRESEVAEIQDMGIGIMPLPDEPWARGKCGYKLIQYMACGLPVVASPVGVNCDLVRHGENGFLASSSEEWSEALRSLIENPELRRQMGAAGRARVEAEYSLNTHAPRLEALIRLVAH